ncbi:MAG: HAD-IA family hydrolase [Flavobacteriales bacterium]|jgi:putative hydrolase of the HAD superfamily|nr:HAD-IA family hydrolase [Flavobacteriales bacterium]
MANVALPDALILDFGGVLYDIDYDAPVRAFKQLGVEDFAGIYHQAFQSPAFDQLECGRIAPADFYTFLESHCAPGTTRQQVIDAWNCILVGMHASRIEMVRALGKQTRLFLFSNTNVIHAGVFEAWMEEHIGLSPFRNAFEGIHYSHELGFRKPDPASFLALCRQHEVDPAKALFIDDSKQHVEGAEQAGLETHWHAPVTDDVAVWLSQRGFKLPESAFLPD